MSVAVKMSEAELQSAIMDLARTLKWKVAHFHDSRRQVRPGVFVGDKDAAGFPDLFLVRGKQALAIELKSDKGKVSDAQYHWLAALENIDGIDCHILRPNDWYSGLVKEILGGGSHR